MLPPASEKATVPLCVDLDGTVIKTDMLWESMVRLLRRNPLYAFLIPIWFARGRAYLKGQIAARIEVDVSHLPLCEAFFEFLQVERLSRPIVLVTASDQRLAERVGTRLGIFSEVMASDGQTNLRGPAKAKALEQRFGPRGFDYAGNSSVDYPVWTAARQAVVVNARKKVANRAHEIAKVGGVFQPLPSLWGALLRSMRPHQWVKNLIIFVPLITAHKIGEAALELKALLAFLAFSLCASAVYWLNDLADLDADRQHPTRRLRPFASGDLPLWFGLVGAPILLLASLVIAWNLSWGCALVLLTYIALTSLYSWNWKQIALVDVFCLASLYTLRLIAGHEATGVEYSSWLLMFSMFIFLSLALVKRFVEINAARRDSRLQIVGRGYRASDAELVASLGASSGFLAVLVLALYVNSEAVLKLYHRPILLLLVCPLLLFWISRVWLLAHRGQMHDDPVVFALKDVSSYVVGALTIFVLWLATGR